MTVPSPSAEQCGELLRELTRQYARAQRLAADCCGAGQTQCQLLIELLRCGPLSQAELGARLCLEKSWISRAVDSLVGSAWAERGPNPSDARSWLVALTPSGLERARDLNATLDAHAAAVLQRLDDAQRRALLPALQAVLRALRSDIDIAACCPPARAAGGDETRHEGSACSPSCKS